MLLRSRPLARFEVLGPLRVEFDRQAGEGFFGGVAAEPRPLLFGDPESAFYPRFPLRRSGEVILGFRGEALRFHDPMLAQSAWPRSDGPFLKGA